MLPLTLAAVFNRVRRLVMKYDGIIFDLDGTLWDSTKEICETWSEVLSHYEEVNKVVTQDELYGCMGLPLDDIADRLLEGIEHNKAMKMMQECCDLEILYLGEHGGTLYPALEKTLEQLTKTHKLFIVSNCQAGYIECFLHAHNLGKYFNDIECIGRTGLCKGDNNKLIIERNNLKSAIYVGDTTGDAQSAKVAGIPFVYAKYGFGQVQEYDYSINQISDILTLDL